MGRRNCLRCPCGRDPAVLYRWARRRANRLWRALFTPPRYGDVPVSSGGLGSRCDDDVVWLYVALVLAFALGFLNLIALFSR